MGRKIRDVILMVLMAGGCLVLTLFVTQGNYTSPMVIYNLVFWGIIVVLYVIALVAGFFSMGKLTDYFMHAAGMIDGIRENGNLGIGQKIQLLKGNPDLDEQLDEFQHDLNHSQSGICDIEDYVNEDKVDQLIHRRMLELIPDVMTSLGILGTFMGLVWGLREFEPSNYEAMTASVTSLVDGIKVAFLTSIYGLSMSLVFSYSMKNGYSALLNSLQHFLDRFHAVIVPSAEMEAQNILVNNQREQNELLRTLTSEFSDQVAHGFAEALTPTLDQINGSLGNMMSAITDNQQIFLQEIVDSFVAEMHQTFHLQFDQFGKQITDLNEVISRNVTYTEKLYKNLCDEMNGLFSKEEKNMHTMVAELSAMQKKYADTVDGISVQYRQIMDSYQKAQDSSLKNLSKAEQEASRYWVACNQAMQNYLLEAAEAYQKFEQANETSGRLLTAMTAIYQKNEGLMEDYRKQMDSFCKSQQEFSRMTEEFGAVLSQIQAAGNDEKNVYLSYHSDREMAGNTAADRIVKALQENSRRQESLMEESLQRQEEMLEEIRRSLRENDGNDRKKRGFGFRGKKE